MNAITIQKTHKLMGEYQQALETGNAGKIKSTSHNLYYYLDALKDCEYITKEQYDSYLDTARGYK